MADPNSPALNEICDDFRELEELLQRVSAVNARIPVRRPTAKLELEAEQQRSDPDNAGPFFYSSPAFQRTFSGNAKVEDAVSEALAGVRRQCKGWSDLCVHAGGGSPGGDAFLARIIGSGGGNKDC